MAEESGIPRGITFTEVNEVAYILNKNAPTIISSYEIKLALYFAVRDNKQFQLVVNEGSEIEEGIQATIIQNGGVIKYATLTDYTVFFGHVLPDGSEGDGWVLGDRVQWERFKKSQSSARISSYLNAGQRVTQTECMELSKNGSVTNVTSNNIDNENLSQAIKELIKSCSASGGFLFVQ